MLQNIKYEHDKNYLPTYRCTGRVLIQCANILEIIQVSFTDTNPIMHLGNFLLVTFQRKANLTTESQKKLIHKTVKCLCHLIHAHTHARRISDSLFQRQYAFIGALHINWRWERKTCFLILTFYRVGHFHYIAGCMNAFSLPLPLGTSDK